MRFHCILMGYSILTINENRQFVDNGTKQAFLRVIHGAEHSASSFTLCRATNANSLHIPSPYRDNIIRLAGRTDRPIPITCIHRVCREAPRDVNSLALSSNHQTLKSTMCTAPACG